MKIFKYKLEVMKMQEIEISGYVETISVIEQYGLIVLYVLVDERDSVSSKHTFIIHGTGQDINSGILQGSRFIGTVKMANGRIIWHVFKAKQKFYLKG